MKTIKVVSFAVIAFGLFACKNAPDAVKAEATEAKDAASSSGAVYKVDTTASKIEWIGTKVSGYHTGTIGVGTGELSVKDNQLTAGNFILNIAKLEVTGPPGSDTAANRKLLGHLKSKDFFDVTAFPDAKFVITEVKPFSGTVKDSTDPRQESISRYKVADPTHTIAGNLTIKGVTKNIEFPAKVTINGNNIDALAKFNIDRTEWNIVYPGKPDDLIRNDIHLGIEIKASK
ncbi:YceI family protein [Pollutibacter soli]|uniref:YceI family protein n=1 Tax=Pollutibacter soli TaxID=3034157 RepID=UPI003013A431